APTQVLGATGTRSTTGRYDGRSPLGTWLGTLVAHAAISAGRSRRSSVPLESPAGEDVAAAAHPAAIVDPAGVESARVLAAIVERCLEALPAEEKLLLQLYYEQDLTLDAMEPVTRLSRATLSRRLAGIRARLRIAV